jgi:hypothetical protein
MDMKNLSLKNMSLTMLGGGIGYVLGVVFGALASILVWGLVALVSAEFVFYSVDTFVLNFLRSMAVIALIALFTILADKKVFAGKTHYWTWFVLGTLAVVYVMTTYGINVVFHPEDHDTYAYFLRDAGSDPDMIFKEMAMPRKKRIYFYYGIGSGILIGSIQGALTGSVVAFREAFKKRKSEDKKEFDEYSNFINSRLKK